MPQDLMRGNKVVEMLKYSNSTSPSSRFPQSALWIVLIATVLLPSAEGAVAESRRNLLGITERRGNASFLCSPSGPCLRCQYPEKNDGRYRCSETGYRIPLKCEIQNSTSRGNENPQRKLSTVQDEGTIHFHVDRMNLQKTFPSLGRFKWRKLVDTLVTSEYGEQSYITYRSCLPVVPEEKLSVFGFEVIMVILFLVSAPFAYFRQRRSTASASIGMARLPNSSFRL